MDIYSYWLEAIFGKDRTPEEIEQELKDWYEHLWTTM